MKNIFYKIIITTIATVILSVPFVTFAAGNSFENGGIVPPCSKTQANGKISKPCGYTDLIQLGINIMNFAVYLMAILSVLSFVYAGYLYMSSGGDTGTLKQAREIFLKVALGIFFTLGAWLIVHEVSNALNLKPGFSLLQ